MGKVACEECKEVIRDSFICDSDDETRIYFKNLINNILIWHKKKTAGEIQWFMQHPWREMDKTVKVLGWGSSHLLTYSLFTASMITSLIWIIAVLAESFIILFVLLGKVIIWWKFNNWNKLISWCKMNASFAVDSLERDNSWLTGSVCRLTII